MRGIAASGKALLAMTGNTETLSQYQIEIKKRTKGIVG